MAETRAPLLTEADETIEHLEDVLRRLIESRNKPRESPEERTVPFFGAVEGAG